MIDTSLDSLNFYFLLAVVQGIVLSGIIFFQKPLRKTNQFLGLLIFIFSLSLLHLVLESSIQGFNSKFPIPMDFGLAFGPLAYFHVISIKNPKQHFSFRNYLHFLPSLLIDGLLFLLFFQYIRANEDWAYNNIENIQASALFIIFLSALQLCFYTLLIYKESKTIHSLPKESTPIHKWIKIILLTWLIMLGFLFIIIPIAALNIEILDENTDLIYKPMGIIMGICIYGLGYIYLLKYSRRVTIYVDRLDRIKFSEKEIQQKKTSLLSAIKTDQLYKNSTLSVAQLADHMNWPINDVSLIINEAFSTNFNDFINEHRIKVFKKLVDQPETQKYSILGLAEEVGFGSKASFYRAFKKETGLTPSEYLKNKENR